MSQKKNKTIFIVILAFIMSLSGFVHAELLDDGGHDKVFISEEPELVSEILTISPEELIVPEELTAPEELTTPEPDYESEIDVVESSADETLSSIGITTITGLYNSSKGGDLRWKAVPGAEKYAIYRTNGGKRKKIATVPASVLSFMDTSIKDNCWGKVYAYSIAAVANGQIHQRCEAKTLQRLAPMKITSLKSASANTAEIQFVNSTGKNKAAGYEIQYAKTKADLSGRKGSYRAVSLDGKTKTKARISNLSGNTTYYFRVRAYAKYTHSVTKVVTKTWSQYSNVQSVKVKAPTVVVRPTVTPIPVPTPTLVPTAENLPPAVDPSIATYVCNMNTKKFHRLSCTKVSAIAYKNKRYTNWDRTSIMNLGFSRCKICYP